MRWFTKSAPARPGAAFRTRLTLESLDLRAAPASLSGTDSDVVHYPTDGTSDVVLVADQGGTDSRAAAAPRITGFAGEEERRGWYVFTGRVTADQPGGLTVTFRGVPSLEGKTVVTASDGTFELRVEVQTDGSDEGTVTAQTTDANGVPSNVAVWDITPTR
jgi:hypothetical protein